MSAINTNGLDVNYPIPGQNNSSQGFRNNFASIKTNLDTAGTEISDLQNKVVVKSALDNTIVNNDMANTLISNCATRSFRATTYNLGNALSGTVTVNCSLGDVQYGTVASNVTFNFASWGPAGTQSNVELQLATSNSQAFITFPAAVVSSNNNFGLTTLENYDGTTSVSFPYGVSLVDYRLSSMDCGNTITIEPYNRPRQTTQIQQRTPSPKGYQGDVVGTTCVDSGTVQLTLVSSNTGMSLSSVVIANTSGGFTCSATSLPLVVGQQLIISGTAGGTGSISGYSNPTTYYIIATNGSTTFQLSTSSSGANITTTAGTPTGLTYKVNNGYLTTSGNTTQLYTDIPIVFTGVSMEANITVGTTYYVSNVASSNTFAVSSSIGGANVNLAGNASPTSAMLANPVQYMYVATQDYNSTQYTRTVTNTNATGNLVTLDSTTSLTENDPIVFTGTTFGGITAGTIYYIKAVSSPNVTLSRTRTNGVAGSTVILTTASGNCTATVTSGSDIWKRTALTSW
jgi:hypothetical protein